MKKRKIFISRLLNNRNLFIESVLLVVLLSFLIGLLSSTFVEFKLINPLVVIIASLISISLIIIYIYQRLIGTRIKSSRIKGFIIYDHEENKLIEAPRYRFSSKSVEYLNALFNENEAFQNNWDEEPLKNIYEIVDDKHFLKKDLFSVKLITELVEYIFLSQLSSHLSEYFNKNEFDSNLLKTFSRSEIPDILLSNKFLELFSKSMDERPSFGKDFYDDLKGGKVVAAFGGNGVLFNHFELTLPVKSKLYRGKNGALILKTKRFTLEFSVHFDGTNTVLPMYYLEHVIGVSDFIKIHEYNIDVQIDIKFNFFSLFQRKGWDYYQWLDSFISRLKKTMSMKRHFNKISWQSTQTFLELKNMDKKI